MMDEILKKLGVKYEDLTAAEKDTLNSWLKQLSSNQLTVDDVRTYIEGMRDAVEAELTQNTHNTKHDILLKARLRNYMLLEAFLTTPEKAKAQIERAIAGMVPSV